MTHQRHNTYARMHIGIGLMIGIVAGILLNSIPLGIALGLVFGLSIRDDHSNSDTP